VGLKIKEKVMKKIFLLFVSIVLAGALVTGCAQPESPSSYDITYVTPGAEGVAAEKIVAESYENFILVYWDKVAEATQYSVWRRELDENHAPLENTIVCVTDSPSQTSAQKIPYITDSGIKDGVSYQYGVALRSYKEGNDAVPYSEIVWQVIGETPVVAKRVNDAVTVPSEDTTDLAQVFAKLKVTATPYDQANGSSTTSQVNVKDAVKVEIEGLTPGFNYSFYLQYLNKAGSVAETDWTDIYGSTYSGSSNPSHLTAGNAFVQSFYYHESSYISNYLETKSWDYKVAWDYDLSGIGINDTSSSGTYTNWQGRIVVRVTTVKSAQYLKTTPVDPEKNRLASNEKVVATVTGL
jgi:hypothetical protein